MTEQEQLANLAYGAWALATKEDGPAFVREAIEQAYKLGQDAARRDSDRLAGYASASLTLARDALTHLMEERPEEAARTIYRVITALASAVETGADR